MSIFLRSTVGLAPTVIVDCKDVTATEVENEKTEKKEEAGAKPATAPQP